MFQALLSGVCLQTFDPPVSQTGLLQPFRRTLKGSPAPLNHIHQNRTVGNLHGSKFCRLNSIESLQKPTDPHAQDI